MPKRVRKALLCSTSSRPKRRAVSSTSRVTASASPASARWKTASPPACLIWAATRSPASAWMSLTTTVAPSWAKRSAVAAPMPDAAPVMIATLPCNRPAMRSSFAEGTINEEIGTKNTVFVSYFLYSISSFLFPAPSGRHRLRLAGALPQRPGVQRQRRQDEEPGEHDPRRDRDARRRGAQQRPAADLPQRVRLVVEREERRAQPRLDVLIQPGCDERRVEAPQQRHRPPAGQRQREAAGEAKHDHGERKQGAHYQQRAGDGQMAGRVQAPAQHLRDDDTDQHAATAITPNHTTGSKLPSAGRPTFRSTCASLSRSKPSLEAPRMAVIARIVTNTGRPRTAC